MSTIELSRLDQSILKLIAAVYTEGRAIDRDSKAGRTIRSMDQDLVRDLRGHLLEHEIGEAFERATSSPVRSAVGDRTCVDLGDAAGLLTHVAVAELVAQLDLRGAAKVLERIAGDLRRYRKNDVRESVLNHVDQEKYG